MLFIGVVIIAALVAANNLVNYFGSEPEKKESFQDKLQQKIDEQKRNERTRKIRECKTCDGLGSFPIRIDSGGFARGFCSLCVPYDIEEKIKNQKSNHENK